MDVSKLAPYAKTVAAVLGALVVTAGCFLDGNLSNADVVSIVAAWSAVFGVYQVPNKKG